MWLVQTVAAWLASAVFLLTVTGLTGFGAGIVPVFTLVLAFWLCVFYGILVNAKRESWFYMAVLVLVFLLTLICRRYVLEGFRIFWNQASDAIVSGTGWVVPEWELQLSVAQGETCMLLFAGLSACLIALLCCGLTSAAPSVLAVALPVVLMMGMTHFGVEAFFWLLPVLGVSVLMFLYSGWRKMGQPASIVLSWVLCAVAVMLLTFGMSAKGIQSWTRTVSQNLHDTIHEARYETKYTTLPEGDFSEYQVVERKAEPALAVTMSVPQTMYLRGFTGALFEEDRWQPLDREALAKNKDLLYWLNLEAFDQNAQFDAAAAQAQIPENTVTVQNIGVCSYYQYVPFSIRPGSWTQAENLNTDGVPADGERNHVYSVILGTGETIQQVLTHLQTSTDPAVLQYRQVESGYRQFISHYYVQIPDEVKDLLAQPWDQIAGRYGGVDNLTGQQAQECALIFLSQCFPEEGTPEDMAFPLEMADGTTYQYATVAVMTMRYFGIPARYAEGYVISEDMAADHASGETMTVDSSCARAWVEVYQDGIGWIPMDLTPGMGEMLKSPNGDGDNPGSGAANQNTTDKQPEEEDPAEQPEPIGGTMVKLLLRMALKSVLTLILLGTLIFLVLWIRRKVLISKKEKKFQSENTADGIAWIYADIALILEKLGFDRGNGSMRGLTEALEAKFGNEFASQFELASDLNDRAMFSSHILSETEREGILAFQGWTLGQLNTEVKWYRRLWLKWFCCLY